MKSVLLFFLWGLLIICACIAIINFVIYKTSVSFIYTDIKNVPKGEAVLIPGAAVSQKGELSPVFRDRVDTAIDLYKIGKASKILVSGDNSTVFYNEVNPVRDYLLSKGIPDADIFLDHAGFDTYSTMYRARDIFKVTSVIISSQSFHLPRAVFIARMLGIKAYGVSADTGSVSSKNYIREMFADEKAVLDLVFHIKPKFLGDAIPISGDGRNYP